ncbi:hypothetical protein KM043_013305 [Ampulex compressa]|nr:hypothetical protein KM043_013305 [Ampulex compressa]
MTQYIRKRSYGKDIWLIRENIGTYEIRFGDPPVRLIGFLSFEGAKAGTNKNAQHSPALTADPLLRSWALTRASTFGTFDFPPFDLLPPSPPSLPKVSSLYLLEAHQRLAKYLATSSLPLRKGMNATRCFKRYCLTLSGMNSLRTPLYQFETIVRRSGPGMVGAFKIL